MTVPTPLTSFVGRRSELATLRRLLRSARLLTLVGPGGCGKTRLAMELARSVKDRRLVWVDLAPIRGREQAEPHILRTVGPSAGGAALVVLDNCEHVLPDAAEAAGRLLRSTPATNVLATRP